MSTWTVSFEESCSMACFIVKYMSIDPRVSLRRQPVYLKPQAGILSLSLSWSEHHLQSLPFAWLELLIRFHLGWHKMIVLSISAFFS